MRAFVLRNAWLGTVAGASVWAAACGSASRPHGGNAGRAGSSAAGAGHAGSSSGGSGGDAGNNATAGTAGSAGSSVGGNGGTAGAAGTSGASGQGESGASGDSGTAASGGEGPPLGGAGDGNEGGSGATAANGGEGGSGAEGGAVHADKLDLLFVVDNSISMFEKQTLLSAAIPKLVQRLVDPWCVAPGQPPTPAGDAHACPDGTMLEMLPVNDMHVGVITTSLGAHGSHDICSEEQNALNVSGGAPAANYDDKGQLLPFVRPSANLPSWNGTGFLNWDPLGHATPVGQSDPDQFIVDMRKLIEATDAHGCGYETTLEAMYRFLVDPEPPKVIDNAGSTTTVSTDPSNTDADVLAQRAAFLRPDSALVVVSLSDEDDCSIDDSDGKQGWLVGYKGGVNAGSFHLPRATAVCNTDPNDACCASCSATLPSTCPTDPACSTPILTVTEDNLNLRCFDQKRRFGIDLLYSLDRYVAGLSSPTVPRRSGGTAPNPLFAGGRDPRLVVFTPIVGVPWQDLAKDPDDTAHLDLLTTREIRTENRWPALVGDYAAGEPPTDPFMVASIDPRTTLSPNTNPFTGEPIVAATSTDPQATINGHEQAVTSLRDDLQFACIFPLGTAVDCTTYSDECDCNEDEVPYNRPLCQPPAGGVAGEIQYFGKAYPGIRHLEVARRLGDKAVVASICARNTTSSSRDDYGYLPAMRALQTRLSSLLGPQ
jgi:hypothetical protein